MTEMNIDQIEVSAIKFTLNLKSYTYIKQLQFTANYNCY